MVRRLVVGFLLVVGLALPAVGRAQSVSPRAPGPRSQAIVTPVPSATASQVISLPTNKTEVMRVNQTVGKIAVSNPAIVDAVALTDHSFYILGKAPGTANISIYGSNSELLSVLDVVVGVDVEGVKAALHAVMPNEKIEVRSVNDSIALSGTVSAAGKINDAIAIAQRFLAEKAIVINNLAVGSYQQVMLQVKVAEMSRSLTRALGFKPALGVGRASSSSGSIGNAATGLTPEYSNPAIGLTTLDPVDTTRFAVGLANVVTGNFSLNYAIDALDQKGAVKILAEPNLVAMSGDTANFLVGGEFPVPVAENNSGTGPVITIVFKPFGVSLAFTPTVIGDGLINLVVAPEVSQIDTTTAPVTVNGFTIPGISTRRARTTVELRDGQSFAIAGLIQSDFTDTIKQLPGIGNVPILGALFRDSSFQRDESEVVIIVTPKLVRPAPEGALASPTDSFVAPSDAEMFLKGLPESTSSGVSPAAAGGGLTGPYGHIIR